MSRDRTLDRLPGFGAAWDLTEPISSSGHPFPLTLSPEEREKHQSSRSEQVWRFDIPSDGPGSLSSGERG